MDDHDASPPVGGDGASEPTALQWVDSGGLAADESSGGASLDDFAASLIARHEPLGGLGAEPPLVTALLDRLVSDDARLGQLIDFPQFSPLVDPLSSRFGGMRTGYPFAGELPLWQLRLIDDEPLFSADGTGAVVGSRPSFSGQAAPFEQRALLDRARRAARLQPVGSQPTVGATPRRVSAPGSIAPAPSTASPRAPKRGRDEAVRPYPRRLGGAGGLAPRMVAEQFPLQFGSPLGVSLVEGLAPAKLAAARVALAEATDAGAANQLLNRLGPRLALQLRQELVGGGAATGRRSPVVLLGDMAISRRHLPTLGAALETVARRDDAGRSGGPALNFAAPPRLGPASVRPSSALLDDLVSPVFVSRKVGGGEDAATAGPQPVQGSSSLETVALSAPPHTPLRLSPRLRAPQWYAEQADGGIARAAAARVEPQQLWGDRVSLGEQGRSFGARHESFGEAFDASTGWHGDVLERIGVAAPERMTLGVSSAPARQLTPADADFSLVGPPAASSPAAFGSVAGIPGSVVAGSGALLPPMIRRASDHERGATTLLRVLASRPEVDAAKAFSGDSRRVPTATVGQDAVRRTGASSPTGELVSRLLGQLGLPAALGGQALSSLAGGIFSPAAAATLERLAGRSNTSPLQISVPGLGSPENRRREFKGVLEQVGSLLPEQARGAYVAGVASALGRTAGGGSLVGLTGAEESGPQPATAASSHPYFNDPRLVGSLERGGALTDRIHARRDNGGRLLKEQAFLPTSSAYALAAAAGTPPNAIPRPGGLKATHGFQLDVDFALMQAMDAWEAAYPGRAPYLTPRGPGEGNEEPDFRSRGPLPRSPAPLPAHPRAPTVSRAAAGLLKSFKLDDPVSDGFATPGVGGRGSAPAAGVPMLQPELGLEMTLIVPMMKKMVERSSPLFKGGSGASSPHNKQVSLGDKKAEYDPDRIEFLVNVLYERIWELMDLEKQRRGL